MSDVEVSHSQRQKLYQEDAQCIGEEKQYTETVLGELEPQNVGGKTLKFPCCSLDTSRFSLHPHSPPRSFYTKHFQLPVIVLDLHSMGLQGLLLVCPGFLKSEYWVLMLSLQMVMSYPSYPTLKMSNYFWPCINSKQRNHSNHRNQQVCVQDCLCSHFMGFCVQKRMQLSTWI